MELLESSSEEVRVRTLRFCLVATHSVSLPLSFVAGVGVQSGL